MVSINSEVLGSTCPWLNTARPPTTLLSTTLSRLTKLIDSFQIRQRLAESRIKHKKRENTEAISEKKQLQGQNLF